MKRKVQKDKTENAKLVISLLIVFLAFGVFLLFNTNKDAILESSDLKSLMTLIIVGMGLLVGLLFLVNISKPSNKRKS